MGSITAFEKHVEEPRKHLSIHVL